MGSPRDVGDEYDEQSTPIAEDKVFVAVPEDVNYGKSTLLWALQNLVKDGTEVVIAHIHSLSRNIHKLEMKFNYTSLRPEEVRKHRKLEREKAEKNIDEYALIAKLTREDLQIDCEKVIIEMDDISQGLEELIARHGITKLVMGAAKDQHYSKEMTEPKSKIALKLMETAAPSCKLWFTCNGHLICTREIHENLHVIRLPTAQSTTARLSVCSISSQMGSVELKNEIPNSKGCTSGSMVEPVTSEWDYYFGDWGRGEYGQSRTDNDAIGTSGATTLPVIIEDAKKLRRTMYSRTHKSDDVHFLYPGCPLEEEKPHKDGDMYEKLQEACTEADLLKEEADEESNKCLKAEMNLLPALQRVKGSHMSYLHEVSQRKETENTIARQRLEIDEMKRRHHALHDELQDSKKQKLILEQRITQIESAVKDYVEEITGHFTKESREESQKRQKIEMDLLSERRKVREIEDLYQNEKMQRIDMEENNAKQRREIKETKKWRDELYYELQDVKEEKLKLELTDVSQELNRRRNAERDLLSALQRVKDLERQHMHEIKMREEVEQALARQAEEIQETKGQLDEINSKHMYEIKFTMKIHEEQLAERKHFIEDLQAKYEKLLCERDIAVTEAEELRIKNKQPSMTAKTLTTDFSLFELHQATQVFDIALKMSEGRFGSVYKGFVRNTTVAIRLLHPQSPTKQIDFHQEVSILSRMRHPNLITLIGACPEASALVYEFLPNGNLEDRLSCKKNTPPLTWQVRTRIIGEICSCLTFIHSHKPHPIVHGNLKLDSIFLDANFVSKLSICRFLSTWELTTQWDVCFFGIIILRLLTGRSPEKIVPIVEEALEKEQLHSIMDASAGSWPILQANQLARLGLRCTDLSGRCQSDLTGEAWDVIEPLMKAASLKAGRSSFSALSDDTNIPASFVCPISQEVMSDPHIASDGFTYEAEAIKGWLDSGHDTSPMTNLKLPHCMLTPNRALRSAILEWKQWQPGS